MDKIKKSWRGILLCIAIAIPSFFLGKILPIIGGPVFGILMGMILSLFWKEKDKFQFGIGFTSKKILQHAVILLGFGMNLSTIMKTGKDSLPIIISTIAISLIIAFLFYKLLKLSTNTAILIGVGSSICGGSAIAATAPIIEAKDEEIATSISVIFLFNVIAALIFPTIGTMIGLSNEGFALFAGTAVNDTSSVTAAASAWDGIYNSNTLEIATIVKLTRTLAIIPITLTLAVLRSRQGTQSEKKLNLKSTFPLFILYFILASILTTIFPIPNEITTFLKNTSKFFIIMAMTAIGLNTNLIKLVKSGTKPILTGFFCWISIAIVSLMMQRLLHIW